MTDNEIIKTLECCAKDEWNCDYNCPFFEKCSKTLMAKSALDLINRQKAEIKNLKAEIAEHKAMLEAFDNELVSFNKAINHAASEAIKEFTDRLKEYRNDCPMNGKEYICMDIQEIDNLVKEMKEVKENGKFYE